VKTINRQSLKKTASAGYHILWFNIARFCKNLFSISFFILFLQIAAFAAEDSNQSAQGKILTTEDFPEAWPETRKILKLDLPTEDRINMIIQILDKESVELSLSRLDEYRMYTWGGIWIYFQKSNYGEDEIPLKLGVCQKDPICIIANRRFLKLIEELPKLPKENAAHLVGREMSSALSEYTRLWDEQMEYSNYLKKKEYRDPNKPTRFLILYREDGKPTLVAMRLKVLTLALIAGNLRLYETQPEVGKILEAALEQRNNFYENPIFNKIAVAPMLVEAGLYQRQILATAVLGTYVDPAGQEEILVQFRCKLKTEKLQPYNVPAIRYGRICKEYGPSRFSEGNLIVKYLEPLDDFKFDGIVNSAIKARQQNTIPAEPVN
jgi:hypothetical protein